jgi:hypothetical protein
MKLLTFLGLVGCFSVTLFYFGIFAYSMLCLDGVIYATINKYHEGWPEVAMLGFLSIFGLIGLIKLLLEVPQKKEKENLITKSES